MFDNLDDIVSSWSALLLEVLDRHAPIRHHRIKKKYQPDWLTLEIKDLMKERNKCKRKEIWMIIDIYETKFQNKLRWQKRKRISRR